MSLPGIFFGKQLRVGEDRGDFALAQAIQRPPPAQLLAPAQEITHDPPFIRAVKLFEYLLNTRQQSARRGKLPFGIMKFMAGIPPINDPVFFAPAMERGGG